MSPILKRRRFLGSVLLGGAFPAATGRFSIAAQNESRLKKAVKLGMVKTDMSILDKFKLLRNLGYDGVELNSPNSFDTDEVLEARNRSGLPIHGVVDSVHWRKTLSDADPKIRGQGLEGLKTALRDAHSYGATSVLLVPAVVTREVPYDVAYTRSQEEVRKALPLARELGIKILFENVSNRFLFSPLEFARYIDEFQSPLVGAYFDIGNIISYGWPEQWIKILGSRIVKLDIKDRFRESVRGQPRPKIGDGDCNWAAVRQALDDIGFEEWATAEVAGGDAARLRDILSRMNQVVDPRS